AAVAAGNALDLVNVSDPTHPVLTRSINLTAQAVQVADGVAYVAGGNTVAAVDLLSGEILSQHTYAGGSIDDLAIADGSLYLVAHNSTEPHTVSKVALHSLLADPISSVVINNHPTFGRLHIFAGGGYVYVGAADNNDSQQIPGVEVIQDQPTGLTLVGP